MVKRSEDSDDRAAEHAHDGSTFDADEGDPGGTAFAGGPAEAGETDGSGDAEQPREHGYGYE